jgi:hypothetical protein
LLWEVGDKMVSSKRAASKDKGRKGEDHFASKPPAEKKPLIFISHDTRDAELAEAFGKLLSNTSAGVLKSFWSSDRKGSRGIEYGVEWYPELMRKLNSASDIVCLLTQRSLDRPWILYEAGVARGKIEAPVIGLALGISLNRANTGPFAQFQNSDDSEDSITNLVMQLVLRIPDAEPDRDAISLQVRAFKERASEILGELDEEAEDDEAVDESSVAKLFEEVKIMFEDLPSKVEGKLKPSLVAYPRGNRFLAREKLEEYLHYATSVRGTAGFLMALVIVKNEFPWVYRVGIEAYDAIKFGNADRFDRLFKSFHELVGFTIDLSRNRLLYKFRNDNYRILEELPGLLESVMQENLSDLSRSSKRR